MKKSILILAIVLVAINYGCSKSNPAKTTTEPLTVTTAEPVKKTSPQAVTLGGNVTKDGGKPVTEKGICVGDAINPVITNTENLIEKVGTGLGEFGGDLDLEDPQFPIGTYHYRAYATNADGTAYGQDKTFVKE